MAANLAEVRGEELKLAELRKNLAGLEGQVEGRTASVKSQQKDVVDPLQKKIDVSLPQSIADSTAALAAAEAKIAEIKADISELPLF